LEAKKKNKKRNKAQDHQEEQEATDDPKESQGDGLYNPMGMTASKGTFHEFYCECEHIDTRLR